MRTAVEPINTAIRAWIKDFKRALASTREKVITPITAFLHQTLTEATDASDEASGVGGWSAGDASSPPNVLICRKSGQNT